MANIAQTVNVLQSVILTKGEKMILTPTYHVFDLYKEHQDNILLPIKIRSEQYKHATRTILAIHGSASIDIDENIHISLSNLNPNQDLDIEIQINDYNFDTQQIESKILRGKKMNAHNTFDAPENVKPEKFGNEYFRSEGKNLYFQIPQKSIMVIKIKRK